MGTLADQWLICGHVGNSECLLLQRCCWNCRSSGRSSSCSPDSHLSSGHLQPANKPGCLCRPAEKPATRVPTVRPAAPTKVQLTLNVHTCYKAPMPKRKAEETWTVVQMSTGDTSPLQSRNPRLSRCYPLLTSCGENEEQLNTEAWCSRSSQRWSALCTQVWIKNLTFPSIRLLHLPPAVPFSSDLFDLKCIRIYLTNNLTSVLKN